MRKYGLTLTQVLLPLAVLAFVAVFFSPVFLHRHESPCRSSCQSYLKQIALGLKQYAQDWNGFFPPAKIGAAAGLRPTAPYGWADALQPYLKIAQIYQCPGESQQGNGVVQPWEAGYTDYFYNTHVSQKNETAFNNSANTVMLADGNDGTEQNDAAYAHSSTPPAWVSDVNSPLHRHLEGCNYAFVDGHVKWLNVLRRPTILPATGSNFTFNS